MRVVLAAAMWAGVTVCGACKGAHAPETEAAADGAADAPAADAPVADDTPAWTPSESQAEMVRLFSARDGAAPCPLVEAGSDDPVADLLAIVEHVEKPPWVGVRAAACVAGGHAEEARDTLVAWVTDEHSKGLAIALVGMLDGMPADVALAVATAGAEGPYSADLAKRADQVKNQDVREALAAGAAAAAAE